MSTVKLRRLWFQIHKWIGLLLAIAILPLCITGSALVWHEPMDRALHPARYAVAGPAALSPDAYANSARAALDPGEKLSRLTLPAVAGEPVEASAAKPSEGRGRPQRITLYLDPVDAHLIEKQYSGTGIFQVMHVIHGSLMIPGWGRAIVGWVGVAMLLSSLTGLWLWWPLSGGFARGFRWKRHPKNTDSNLHHLFGFWISVPLFVLSLTGVWISFPQVFSTFDGAQRPASGPSRAAQARAQPLAAPATPLADAVANAGAVAPGTVRSVSWPTDLKPEWAIQTAPAKGRPASVSVRDADGVATVEKSSGRAERPQTLARTMRRIHDGGDMPFAWQVIVFLGGLLPAVLAVTGIIMWWRARQWRGDLARRRAAKAGG